MEEPEIRERLAKAEVTRDTLDRQFKASQAETKRLGILSLKWAGVADYFKSLLPETQIPKPKDHEVVPFTITGFKPGSDN